MTFASLSRWISQNVSNFFCVLAGVTLSVLTYFAFSALRDGYQKPSSMETIFSDDDDDDWAKVKDYSDSAAWAYGFVVSDFFFFAIVICENVR